MANIEILSRRQLESETRYSYCPYCYKEKLPLIKGSNNLEMKDVLEKLYLIKTKELIPNRDKTDVLPYFDSYYECENCNRKITVDDFYRFYVAKADGTPFYARKQEY